jgi:hypothetical protein
MPEKEQQYRIGDEPSRNRHANQDGDDKIEPGVVI